MNVLNLIQDYLLNATNSIQEMQRHFGVRNILRARREKIIPDKGAINGEARFEFSFHGIGCSFSYDKFTIDADFDENGDCKTFDAWRLWIFAKNQVDQYGFANKDEIRNKLEELLNKGQIFSTESHHGDRTYRII